MSIGRVRNATIWQFYYSTRVVCYPILRIVIKKSAQGRDRQAGALSSTHLDLGLEAGAAELVHLLDVLLHCVLLGRTLALGPLIKLGLGLLVEEAAGPGCGSPSSNIISRRKARTQAHADEDTRGAGGASGQAPIHAKEERQKQAFPVTALTSHRSDPDRANVAMPHPSISEQPRRVQGQPIESRTYEC